MQWWYQTHIHWTASQCFSSDKTIQFNNHEENTVRIIHDNDFNILSCMQVMCQQSNSGTTLVCIAPPLSVLNSYTVVMDAAPGPDNTDLRLLQVDNPVATQLRKDSKTKSLVMNDSTITIDVCTLYRVEIL